MADYGLLNGLAEGIKQGLTSYQDVRQRQKQDQLNKILMHEKGFDIADDGTYTETPEHAQAGLLAKQQTTRSLGLLDPTSSQSQSAQNLAKTVLNSSNPGLASKVDLSQMSGADLKDDNGLISKAITGGYGAQKNAVTNERINNRNEILAGNLEERQNTNAGRVGQEFENNPIMKQLKQTSNSIDRMHSIINGKQPVTAQTMNMAQQDLINAVAPGGAATEGKVNRELIDNYQMKINELKTKFGDVSDLRQSPSAMQLVKYIDGLGQQIKQDYSGAMAQQAVDLHDSNVNTSNQKTLQTIKEKLSRYAPEEYQKRYGDGGTGASPVLSKPSGLLGNGGQQQGQQSFTPDVVNYATQHGISSAAALAIKQQRGGQ